MTDEKDPEELLAQSKEQKRHTSEPSATDDEPEVSLEEHIVDAYSDINSAGGSSNLTMRDANLAALIRGLENADLLDDVGADLRDELGKDHEDSETRSSVLSLLARVGLQEARPELLETGKEAKRSYREQLEIDF